MAPEPNPMRPTIEQYAEDLALVRRYHDLPMSAEDVERKRAFFRERQATLGGVDFDALDQDGRVEYLLFQGHLGYELRKLDLDAERWQQAAPFLPFASRVVEFASQRRAMARPEPREVAENLAALGKEAKEARTSLEARLDAEGAIDRVAAHRALGLLEALRERLKEASDFYNEYDPVFTWWAAAPHEKAEKALEDYELCLREKVLGIKEDADEEPPIFGDPIGREALVNELAHEWVPYTPEELVAVGRREMAWCEAELTRAASDMGCGDWREALERVKRDHVDPGDQPTLIRDLAVEAIEFLEARDLVTIPPLARELWRMAMMSPERQKVNPFFTGGETITVSFPTSTMPHDDKLMSLRGNNIHFARATVQHELIPGHHLQGFMARRHRPHRRVFHTPFLLEGWALYWEMLLWDLGFQQSPENRVGMLFWRLHRAARIVFSLRFHLGEITADECVQYLVERVGHEAANGRGEVKRSLEGGYVPLYQCAYMLGGLQIRALSHELVATGQMTPREFHDALLRENSIPVELIRARLTGQELSADFASSWRFADEPV